MVLADSHRISRAPRYSGTKPNQCTHEPSTRLSRSPVNHPRLFNSTHTPATPPSEGVCIMSGPTTPHAQPSLGITHTRFSHHPLSLATTNGISLPMGTKMFHFPTFLPYWLLNSPAGNTPLQVLGSPIQKSPDQHLLVNSPRHIADRHVFHQLLIPRHPPNAHKNYKNKHTNEPTPNTPTNKGQCAWSLKITQTKQNHTKIKMQTTTIQFTNNPHPTHQTNPKRPASSVERKPDSVPQPQSKDHDQKMFATPTKK